MPPTITPADYFVLSASTILVSCYIFMQKGFNLFFYFVFLIVIGWIFRTFSSNTSDYFKGGGKMLWWMVGSTAFMTQFSAWSFTGAAGKAFSNGLSVMMIFLGNALGYFFNYLFFAAKSRQVRVVTPIEGIRLRFGKVNEQVFT